MGSVTGTINSNTQGANGVGIALTTETVVTLYVMPDTGVHRNHQIGLEVSPDGTNFMDMPERITGTGVLTTIISAAYVKAKVYKPESGASGVKVHIVVR